AFHVTGVQTCALPITLNRLLLALTRSQRGATNLTRLRVSVVSPHNVLVHANRDLTTQAQQQRLFLSLGKNVTHDLPRKAVGVQTIQVTLVRSEEHTS